MREFDPVAYINEPRWQEVKPGLERIRELMGKLGDPQKGLRVVHVAGTNGKGSTCAYVDAILRAAGFRTGLFTSPYIVEFAERIRVDGVNISSEELLACTLLVREQAQTMDEHPTEFELMTAVALLAFSRAETDFCVLEVGLGGLLDSTNVVETPQVCALAPIAKDHMKLLGNTIQRIAAEKAGVIKPGAIVVSAPQTPEAAEVIRVKAEECGCELRVVGECEARVPENATGAAGATPAPAVPLSQHFDYDGFPDLQTSLLGTYQPHNAALAIEIALALCERGFSIPDEAIREGVAAARWPGRFEIVAQDPTFVVDGGHNVQGIRALMQSLKTYFPNRPVVFVLGVLADKQYPEMVEEIMKAGSVSDRYVCTQPPNPRALPAERLESTIAWTAQDFFGCSLRPRSWAISDIAQAVGKARELAGEEGLVVAAGSLYSIGAILAALR